MRKQADPKTGISKGRRVLAGLCAVCMIALQCFMLGTINPEKVYAATDGITIKVTYNNGKDATLDISNKKLKDKSTEKTISDDEGNNVQIKGVNVQDILKDYKITSGSVSLISSSGSPISVDGDTMIVLQIDGTDVSSYQAYSKNDKISDLKEIEDTVEVSKDTQPVTFKSGPSPDKKDPTVGDEIKITYTLQIDDFYKISDGYDEEKATKLTWSGSSGLEILTPTTTGITGTARAKVKNKGSLSITANSDYMESGGKSTTVNGKPTTKPTTKKPTTKKPTTKKPTTKKPTTNKSTTKKSTTKPTTRATTRATTRRSGGGGGYYRPTRSTYRPTTRTSSTVRPTTATRPTTSNTATGPTAAPSFQTIKVKEVTLGARVPDPAEQEEYGYDDQWDDEGWDDEEWEDEEWDEDGVTFGAAAGSAAVAAAACGAGAVGRVRRFRVDMSGSSLAEGMTTSADGPGKGSGASAKGEEPKKKRGLKGLKAAKTPDAGADQAVESGKKSVKNLLKRK